MDRAQCSSVKEVFERFHDSANKDSNCDSSNSSDEKSNEEDHIAATEEAFSKHESPAGSGDEATNCAPPKSNSEVKKSEDNVSEELSALSIEKTDTIDWVQLSSVYAGISVEGLNTKQRN